MQLDCIVLAAGKANRFGSQKLLQNLSGKPILQYSLESIPTESFKNIVAVTSDKKVADFISIPEITTVFYEGGPVSDSIREGIRKIMDLNEGFLPDGILFLNADQPFTSKSSIRKMVSCFENSKNTVVRIKFNDTPGNPVIFPKCTFDLLLNLTGDHGGCSILDNCKCNIVYFCPEEKAELFDIDTEENLLEAEAIMRRKI